MSSLDGSLCADTLTGAIIGAAIAVHRHLGPGLLESAYRRCLIWELEALSLPTRTELLIPLTYRGRRIENAYRVDLLVADTVVVEVKAARSLHHVDEAQLLTYLRLLDMKTGLLLNFNTPVLKDGIRRLSL